MMVSARGYTLRAWGGAAAPCRTNRSRFPATHSSSFARHQHRQKNCRMSTTGHVFVDGFRATRFVFRNSLVANLPNTFRQQPT